MATLSAHDRDVIACHHLDSSLDHLKKSLQDAEQSYSFSDSHDNAKNSEQDRQDIISRLLTTLTGTKLALIFRHLQKGDFNYSYYRPLVGLVIQKASDSEIWSAVLDLITTLTRMTPAESMPATFHSTPITHSSASQQDAKQIRELLERKVFEEIRFCTYRDVEGLFDKYFEGKDWTRRALEVYEATKDRHVDGAWTDLPGPLVQVEVLEGGSDSRTTSFWRNSRQNLTVKPLCRELRGILFPIHKDKLFTGTPKDAEILYGPILGAFDKAIDDIKAIEG